MTDAAPNARERLLRWWDRYWFPTTTPVRLAVIRIITVALLITWFQVPLSYTLELGVGEAVFDNPQTITLLCNAILGGDLLHSAGFLTTVHWTTQALGVLALIGLFTRPAMFGFAAGCWFLVAHSYSYGEKHHPEAIYCMFIMLMAFSPCNRCLSLDNILFGGRGTKPGWGVHAKLTTAMWPIKTVQVLLCIAYLYAGMAKMYISGFDWLNGYTLQYYILRDSVRLNAPIGQWMAHQHALCQLLSISTVAFELGFWLVLFFRRLVPVFLIVGVMFHIGIELTMAATFAQFLVLYLTWVPWERLPWFREKGDAPASPNPAPSPA